MMVLLKGRGAPLSLAPVGQIRAIGERINSSGRKRLQQAMANRDWAYVAAEAQRQVESGAHIFVTSDGRIYLCNKPNLWMASGLEFMLKSK